ncbi:MAG: hypothetical protein SchgKO_15910 [Schleiferiaceae bacterium]
MTLLRNSAENKELLHQLLLAQTEEDKSRFSLQLEENGVSIKRQERWIRSHKRFEKRRKNIKARASYSGLEKILIVAFAPFSLAFLEGGFSFEADKEYVTMRKQGTYYLTLGLSLWVSLAVLAYLPFVLD